MEPRPLRLFLISLLAFVQQAAAEVDLSIRGSETDDYKFTALFFSDGSKRISYRLPKDWTWSKIHPDRIKFSPPGLNQAESEIAVEKLAQPFAFDEEGKQKLKEKARDLVPKDAEEVQFIGDQSNPIMIGGHDTYEVTLSFILFGQHYKMGLLFAHIGGQQMRFRTIARPEDFDAVHSTFRSSLCSWQWL
jgi:hypothetical protein